MSNQQVDGYWKQFIEQVYNRYSKIWPSAQLFGEALRCFKSEAYLGTCAMCRAAIEALLHLAKTTKGDYERELAPDTQFKELFRWARRGGLLQGIRRKVERIRKQGDFSVHLAQQIDRGYTKSVPNSVQGIKIGVSQEEARQTILDTADAMLKIINRRWPLEMPSPDG